jgi:PadR family transcriptional regulator PadR
VCDRSLTVIRDIYYIVSMQRRRNKPHDPVGEFETLVLMAVLRLRDDSYGMRIHREIEDRAGRRCSLGALYTTLERLEKKGYVSSRVGESTPERGGRAKKYFKLQARGASALREAYSATMKMAHGIEPLLGAAQ